MSGVLPVSDSSEGERYLLAQQVRGRGNQLINWYSFSPQWEVTLNTVI